MTSNSLVLTPINGEPRVHDLHLADRLGFDQPRDIRKLIKRNLDKLDTFGPRATVARCIEVGNGVKREVEEFYLNQKQSVWVCMKSETEKAFEVQVEIVRVFDAYLTGTTLSLNPRLFFAAARIARGIDLARDAGVKQALIWELKAIHGNLGLPFPAIHLFGKDPGQMQLEV